VIVSAFVEEINEQRHAAEAASVRDSQALAEADAAKSRLDAAEDEIRALTELAGGLERKIEQMSSEHSAAMIHAAEDLRRLRARLSRRIEDEITLLEEGLSAIRRDPPTTHVMEDHAERAINAFRAELRSLSSRSTS
jgi:chromosome segregation ATPase